MRRVFVVSAVICGLMSLSMPMAWASGPDTVRVEGLGGELAVRTSVQADWQDVDGSTDLVAGASLRTGSGAEALVQLPGDVVLRVSGDSRLQVSSLGEGKLAVQLDEGRLFASVPGEAADLTVSTPKGLAVSNGGEFTVEADAQDTRLRVISGSARLSGDHVAVAGAVQGEASEVEVPAGVEAVAQGDQGGGSGGTGAGQGGGASQDEGAGGDFPIFAVLGGLGLIALIAVLISQSSEVQSG